MTTKKKRTKPKSLAHGRHPNVKPPPSLSSKATRTVIRTHHTLQKRRAKALAAGDTATAAAILQEIETQGGIEIYQHASLLGQKNERGGDSSRVMMEWLKAAKKPAPEIRSGEVPGKNTPLRMLEVGALSTSNACSRSGIFEIERIDLNSQAEGIKQQDFMEKPLPEDPSEQFDIISLSLVLNYVPDPAGRGEMLERTLKFLRQPPMGEGHHLQDLFPSLFLVLPAPCLTNSRYLDEPRLESLMESLGYVKVQKKVSNKLAYYLWKATDLTPKKPRVSFKKVEVRPGKTRNNFAIVLY